MAIGYGFADYAVIRYNLSIAIGLQPRHYWSTTFEVLSLPSSSLLRIILSTINHPLSSSKFEHGRVPFDLNSRMNLSSLERVPC